MESWKTRIFVIATILGAAAGLAAGYVVVRRSEEINQAPHISAGDGLKLGLGVMGLLRLVSEFAEDNR